MADDGIDESNPLYDAVQRAKNDPTSTYNNPDAEPSSDDSSSDSDPNNRTAEENIEIIQNTDYGIDESDVSGGDSSSSDGSTSSTDSESKSSNKSAKKSGQSSGTDLSFDEVTEEELLDRSGNGEQSNRGSQQENSDTDGGGGGGRTAEENTALVAEAVDDTGQDTLVDRPDNPNVPDQTEEAVAGDTVEQLNEDTAGADPFDRGDVSVTTEERNGETVAVAELTDSGQRLNQNLNQARAADTFSQQLSEQTGDDVSPGDDFTVEVSDGEATAEFTDSYRLESAAAQSERYDADDLELVGGDIQVTDEGQLEAAAQQSEQFQADDLELVAGDVEVTNEGLREAAAQQSDQFQADDLLVDSQGDVFVSTEAQKEQIAAERSGVSADDVVLQDRRTDSGDIETRAVIQGQGAAEEDPQTQLDRSVATFENLTGTDIPGEGDIVPNVDVSEEIESATGINVPTSQEISDGVQNQIDRVATGASENEFVSGTTDVATEVLERAPTDEAAAVVGASAAATPVGQIATSETAQDIADEAPSVEDVTQTLGASAAATPLGQIATSETAQDVAEEVPSVDDVTRRLGSSVAVSPAFQVASSETAQDVATGFGGVAVAGAAASPLGQIVGSDRVQATVDDVLELGGEATDRVVSGGGQAAEAVGGALGTGLAASPAVQLASNDRAQQLPGQALGAGQDVVEALRVTDELGADSEAEARRQLESEGPVASVLRDTGLEIETELAQFTSDDPDSVVADRVEESRREDALEGIQNGPAASPAPAIGRNPGSAIRGLNLAGRAAQSGQAARAAAGISGLIGGGVAINELTVPEEGEDSDRNELTVGESQQDVTELDVGETEISELDVDGTQQNVDEIDIPMEDDDIDATLQLGEQVGEERERITIGGEDINNRRPGPGVRDRGGGSRGARYTESGSGSFSSSSGRSRGTGSRQGRSRSISERLDEAQSPNVTESEDLVRQREDLAGVQSGVVSRGTVGQSEAETTDTTAEELQQAAERTDVSDVAGPGQTTDPFAAFAPREDSRTGTRPRVGVGADAAEAVDQRLSLDQDLLLDQPLAVDQLGRFTQPSPASTNFADGPGFGLDETTTEVTNTPEATAETYEFEYGFGDGNSTRRKLRLPDLDSEDNGNTARFDFLATATTFDTGVLQDPDEATGFVGGSSDRSGSGFGSGGDLDRFDQLL